MVSKSVNPVHSLDVTGFTDTKDKIDMVNMVIEYGY